MAKFKSFSEDSLSFAITNIEKMDNMILENPYSNEWVEDFFKDHKLQYTSLEFDIQLKSDYENPAKYDVENAIALYELLTNSGIGEAKIFNDKFFPAFTLQYAYKYFASHRVYEKHPMKGLNKTMFFETDSRRGVAYQIVGRLYLMVRMSVDEREEDKYKYTRYMLKHSGLRRMVFYTYVDNKIASLAFIKAVYDYEEKHSTTISTGSMNDVLTHLSCLSNVNHVPAMTEEEVYKEMMEYLEEEKF